MIKINMVFKDWKKFLQGPYKNNYSVSTDLLGRYWDWWKTTQSHWGLHLKKIMYPKLLVVLLPYINSSTVKYLTIAIFQTYNTRHMWTLYFVIVVSWIFFFLFYIFVGGGGSRNSTQGLKHAWQVLYHWVIPFALLKFYLDTGSKLYSKADFEFGILLHHLPKYLRLQVSFTTPKQLSLNYNNLLKLFPVL